MIQLNLLPDVKLEYIKAQRSRRLVVGISVIVMLAAVGLLLLLLSVDGLQKKHLSDLSNDIKDESATLQGEPQIKRMLTVQNQLGSLSTLHAAEPAASRLFGYLNQLTPATVSISDFNIDFNQHNISITGDSGSLAAVNQYVDILKNTSYSAGGGDSQPAFSNVVLSNFSLNTGSQKAGQAANYTVDLAYDPVIFDITQTVRLSVPRTTTRQLLQGQAGDLFQAEPSSNGGTNQ